MKKLLLALTLLGLNAWAADNAPAAKPPKGSTPVPDGVPVVGNVGEPAVTIRNKGSERIEEYRVNGMLYMIKITPSKGKSYYLIDPNGNGKFIYQEGPVSPMAVPQWVLKTF